MFTAVTAVLISSYCSPSLMSVVVKRVASSPLSDDGEDAKRPCADGSYLDDDPDATIITQAEGSAETHPPAMSIREEFRVALRDPEIQQMLAHAMCSELKEEVALLRQTIEKQEHEITQLKDQVDHLEQYGRRNIVRVGPIPEAPGENTDALVTTLAKSIGVELTPDAIDRSHRVGKRSEVPGTRPRSIIVKLSSYRWKEALMRSRRALKDVDTGKLFPDLHWPPLPSSTRPGPKKSASSVFINEDLTKIRAEMAAKCREFLREEKVDGTWTRDGAIFIKKGETVHRLTTMREVRLYAR